MLVNNSSAYVFWFYFGFVFGGEGESVLEGWWEESPRSLLLGLRVFFWQL